MISGKENSPVAILTDMGYDLWLTNNRGNVFSREHRSLDPNSSEFWDFSFEDMRWDVLANLRKVSDVTGWGKIDYIGYS